MVDLTDKGSSESEEMSTSQTLEIEACSGGGGGGSSQVKTCADCGTTKTPLWRGGPAGPKSLCNACGIRSRKRRRALLGLNKTSIENKKVMEPTINGEDQKIEINCSGGNSSSNGKKKSGNNKLGDSMKRKIQALGDEVVLQRSTMDKLRRKLGEEEQAAVLLMALSCGSFYA